jgi:hypothetical protein
MTKKLNEEQKKVASGVLKVLCFSIFIMQIGTLIYPMFFSILAISKETPPYLIGILMSIPAVVSLAVAPILNRYILWMGIEKTILSVAFTFGGGYIMLGSVAPVDNYNAFIAVNVVAMILIGYSLAANTIGE